jgi:hypothetical protein
MSHRFKVLDERLGDLWYRRDTLTDAEWHELCQLVRRILSSVSYPHYSELQDLPEECIDMFCTDKVFWAAKQPQYQARRMHAGALIGDLYPHYLIDLIRAKKRHQEPLVTALPEAPEQDSSASIEQLCGAVDERDHLYELGLAPEQIRQAAQRFLETQEEWARLYLARHHCPDPKSAVPLSRLAEDYEIASYHYKARQLGIAFPKGGFGNYEDFAGTDLGQWVTGLGVEVNSENQKAVDEVLQILCLAALNWYKEHT